MYAERNLITLTSCEVGYARAAWYGGRTIQLQCVYDRTTVRLFLYTSARRRGTAL